MKKYLATYTRYNPQIGSYKTTRTIEAENKTEARKLAKKTVKGCIYGSMELEDLVEVK